MTAPQRQPRVTLIVCTARNRTIGRDGGMPWRMPSDLRHFKATTMGKPVVMGRKTFQSIGRPLPGRCNIVVTRTPKPETPPQAADGTHVVEVTSLDAAIAAAATTDAVEVMIAGGGQIYAEALPRAERIIQTILAADIDGDTHFPALPTADWHVVARTPLATGPKDDYPAEVVVWERVKEPGHGKV